LSYWPNACFTPLTAIDARDNEAELPFWRFGLVLSAPVHAGGRRSVDYSMILATTPAPTVRPPSRIAKRRPSSIAIGAISVATKLMLSPGITISTPSGSSTAPVTSVVRK